MKELIRIIILLIYIFILFSFKKIIINKIQNKFIKYLLGTILVYALYLYFIYLSRECEFLKYTYNEIITKNHRHIDIGILFYFIPTIYSTILLEQPKSPSHKNKDSIFPIIIFILINLIITLLISIIFTSYLSNQNLMKTLLSILNSLKYIEWKYIIPLILGIILFYFFMKHEHNKNNIKDIIDELNDNDK